MKVNKTIVTIMVMMMIDNGLRITRRWKEYKKGQPQDGCPFACQYICKLHLLVIIT
jgi:hypothetical protein